MSLLHIVRTSPFIKNDFAQCINTLSPNDFIVLIDDGCYAVESPLLNNVDASINILALDEHLNARALTVTHSIKAITMTEFVNLTLTVDKTITWQ